MDYDHIFKNYRVGTHWIIPSNISNTHWTGPGSAKHQVFPSIKVESSLKFFLSSYLYCYNRHTDNGSCISNSKTNKINFYSMNLFES